MKSIETNFSSVASKIFFKFFFDACLKESLICLTDRFFDELNTKFLQGNCYGIIGANGAGKSTTLKIMTGYISPSSGNVIFMSIVEPTHFALIIRNIYSKSKVGNFSG